MKLLNYKRSGAIRLGLKLDGGIADVVEAAEKASVYAPSSMIEVISGGEAALKALYAVEAVSVPTLDESDVEFAPVITAPSKVLCVGLNYKTHAEEVRQSEPPTPILFMKPIDTLSAHNERITLPAAFTTHDYEAELAVIIGKFAYNITHEEALDHVFGYSCSNDISNRKAQRASSQWLIGKSTPKSGPVGPYIVPARELDPRNLDISCERNDEVVQSSNTGDMIFSVEEIIAYASQYMYLNPGDIIITGTPGGVIVGKPKDERDWLKPGEKISVTIKGIGTLTNTFAG